MADMPTRKPKRRLRLAQIVFQPVYMWIDEDDNLEPAPGVQGVPVSASKALEVLQELLGNTPDVEAQFLKLEAQQAAQQPAEAVEPPTPITNRAARRRKPQS